jgi:hypothetical protein
MKLEIMANLSRKMDTLDFIINILIEQEKRLDNIIERIEKNVENIEKIINNERRLKINEIEKRN